MLVGRNNKGVTETSQATIPLLTVSADGKNINQLHGYQGSVDASLIRDSITPIYENEVKVMLTYAKSASVSCHIRFMIQIIKQSLEMVIQHFIKSKEKKDGKH